ncbi:M4 family metallopeptidase [Nannocystis bainbridge]|uniref:M4 family metallopeptidase n=1 Tax=Nannocystis bainbridge TaxID=2995303 RepID=A0ABT5E4D9_9BACT|nr:M4 family metallopeptidase [Nannocystis bainbridge]MDC0720731.1 M4 family metallopeptidase [Nannocystis bainbridge]
MPSRRLSLFSASLVSLAMIPLAGAAEPTGKHAAGNKTLGKPLARVVAADHPAARPRPLSLAQAGKAAAPAPFVRAALIDLAARSSEPARVRLDPAHGTLRRFDGRVANPHGLGVRACEALLAEHRDVLGLAAAPGAADLVQTRVINGDAGDLALHYDVRFRGLPVWGAEVRAHFDASGALTSIAAQNLGRLDPPQLVKFGADAARVRARRANGPDAVDRRAVDLGPAELGVWPQSHDRGGVLAWRLLQTVSLAEGGYQHFETYVDAEAGRVLARRPLVATETVNSTTGTANDHFGKQVTLRLSHYPGKGEYGLYDRSKGLAAATLQTLDAGNSDLPGNAALATSKTKTAWTAAEATAHAHMQKVIDYFQATHARNSWDGKGAAVEQLIHYGQAYNNAFWDPYNKHMAIGDGDKLIFKEFTRSLDVSAHEYSHAVITGTANLVYQNQPGALNESFADVMAMMIDRDDWVLGEDVVGPGFGAPFARSFIDPNLGGQPKHMEKIYKGTDDYGGVHINSGIPNHAAYRLAIARSRELVEKVWYRTLYKGHIGSQASFVDMAQGTVAACKELIALGQATGADCTATAEAWVDVGVLAASDVPKDGCPDKSSEKDGLCYCDPGFVPSGDGTACVALGGVDCPANSIEANGLCLCQDGFKPNQDGSQCVAEQNGCPLNSGWDAAKKKCVCDPGFEGAPNAPDGKCEPVESDCPADAHPEWADPMDQADYTCACNDNFEDDGNGNCVVIAGTCGNESFFGRCDGDTLVYCQPGVPDDEIHGIDCAGEGLVCGKFDSVVGYDCLNPDGKGAAATCDADGYQECGAGNPFCVSEQDASTGFCSHECKAGGDCESAYDCCASVSDGTRACLVDPYCAENIDTKATCKDIPGGSTFHGKCVGDVLVYCDGSTGVTQEVFCVKEGKECGFVDKATGYSCVDPDSGALPEAPADWCPHEKDGSCDVPDLCPEGSDGADCNACGDIGEAGACDGDLLKFCDPDDGLVTTDCAATPTTPSCGPGDDGTFACGPGPGPDDPTTGGPGSDSEGSDSTGEAPSSDTATAGEVGTITCACRSDAPVDWRQLLLAAPLLLRRRRKHG